jgi:high-affinity K+ transport system ATPase subunit B
MEPKHRIKARLKRRLTRRRKMGLKTIMKASM